MRSQVAVEEIMARTGKLADNAEYKDIWIKRDELGRERKRESTKRGSKRKKREKDRVREEEFLLESVGHETQEVVF